MRVDAVACDTRSRAFGAWLHGHCSKRKRGKALRAGQLDCVDLQCWGHSACNQLDTAPDLHCHNFTPLVDKFLLCVHYQVEQVSGIHKIDTPFAYSFDFIVRNCFRRILGFLCFRNPFALRKPGFHSRLPTLAGRYYLYTCGVLSTYKNSCAANDFNHHCNCRSLSFCF